MELMDAFRTRLKEPIRQAAERALRALDKVATGKTLRSIEVNVINDLSEVTFDVTIGGGAPFIQSGRSAGTLPPIQPIREWMASKNIIGNPWPIAKAIQRDGIDPVDLESELELRFDIALEQQLNDEDVLDAIDLFIQSRLI